jgi:DNA invertase Pin-like site-specific DNA recombinase
MNPIKKKINGVALIRVSTAGQADESRASIPAQREAIRRICEAHGIEIDRNDQFELIDVSGASVLNSPDYLRFLDALKRPEIDAVVTKEFSRLMRPERLEDYGIIQRLIDCGITLYFPDGVMNLANRQDWFMALIRAAVAGNERLEIRQRMMDGKEAMRRLGRHPSAAHTLARGIGYDKTNRRWFYKEEDLAVVRLLFDLFLQGEHNYDRLSKLTGIPRSSIRIILTNPVYAGVMTYRTKHDLRPEGKYPEKNGKRARRRKIERTGDEVIKVPLGLPPVITIEQHRKIVNIVENYRVPRAQARTAAMPRFTYRGYLRCGCCKNLVYSHSPGKTQSTGPKDFYYCKSKSPREKAKRQSDGLPLHCNNRYMTRRVLEHEIDRELTSRLTDKSFLSPIIEAHCRNLRSIDNVDQQVLRNQLDKLQQKRSRVIDLFVEGSISHEEKRVRLEDLKDQIVKVERELSRTRPVAFHSGYVFEIVRVFREWSFLGMDQKRRLMEQILPEIFVDRYHVTGVTLRLSGCDSDNHLRNAK